MSMHRAGIYCRISKDRTGLEAGVTRQREDCLDLASTLGWEVVDFYVDNSVDATSGKPRPEYNRMLEDVVEGRIDAIIAWHTDRLYRRLDDLQELIELCDRHHVAIKTCRAGELDLSTPTGRLVARILGSVAAAEVEIKTDRWYRAVIQNRKDGRWARPPRRLFGYTPDGDVIPEEAAVVRWIIDGVRSGRTQGSLLREMNDRGIRTARGGQWTRHGLRELIKNPRIAGYSVLKGEILGDGDWEPIVDREAWAQAVAILEGRTRQARPRVALLNRLIFHSCGARMLTGLKKDTGRPGYRIYRCPTDPPYNTGCGNGQVAARPVEEFVEAYARGKLEDPRFRRMVAARLDSGRAARLLAEVDAAQRRLAELEEELPRAKGRAASALVAAIGQLEDEIAALQAKAAAAAPVRLPDVGEWPDDLGQRAALIALTLQRVVIHPNPRPTGRRFNYDRIEIVPHGEEPELDVRTHDSEVDRYTHVA